MADFHRNLLGGGVFLYPETDENPEGKLRLLFEAYPMAYIMACAGGDAISSERGILEIPYHSIQQRVGIMVGDNDSIQILRNSLSIPVPFRRAV